MATPDLLASTVMNASASLLNDTARTVYTYTVQLPYLRMALIELRELFELNSIPVTEKSSAVIQVDAGQTEIAFNASPLPELPDDMVEPQQLWERPRGIDPFIPMTKRDYIPHSLVGAPTSQFIYYVWQDNKILLLATTQNNDIKMDYIKELFQDVTDETTNINVINAQSYLQFRTAGLLAEFIERNLTSAGAQNAYAADALQRSLGISSKGKQNIATRRRPFRSGYKRARIII